MPTTSLRAALLLDEPSMPAWACEAIHRAGGHARWIGIILNRPAQQNGGPLRRLWQSRHTALASAYVKLDQVVSPADRDPLAPRDLEMLADVPRLDLNDENLAAIESMSLDVIINFGSQPPQEKLAAAATMGIWSFKHDAGSSDAKLAGLAAVVENHDVNRSTLEMQTSDGRRIHLAEICTAVDRLSAARNRSNLYWPAVSLLPRQLEKLHRLGAEQFRIEAENKNATASKPSPSVRGQGDGAGEAQSTLHLHEEASKHPLTIGNRKLFPGLARLAMRRLKRKLTKSFYCDQWLMLSHFDPSLEPSPLGRGQGEGAGEAQSTLDPHSGPLPKGEGNFFKNFRPITPPIDRFWADPHVVCHGGKPYVFFEEYLYDTGKAHISVMEFNDQGNWHSARPVLERPYHLSYPFLFTWQGQQYMIPETSANRTLEVYRCDEFPDRWSLHKTLMTGVNAFDATLVEVAGHWWMFVTLAENGGSSWDELFLFHADHPLSDHWLPHPMNPIVSDVRRARPAGPIFMKDGQLYRPAQDCSRTYGYGIRLHRIVEITPTKYAETEVQFLEPLASRGWLATHTLSSAGGLTMIDAQRRRSKFSRRSGQPADGTAETQRADQHEEVSG